MDRPIHYLGVSLTTAVFFLAAILLVAIPFLLGVLIYHHAKRHAIHLPSFLAITANYVVSIYLLFLASSAIDVAISRLAHAVDFVSVTVIISLCWFAVFYPILWLKARPYYPRRAWALALRTSLLLSLLIAGAYLVSPRIGGKSLADSIGSFLPLFLVSMQIGIPFFRWGTPKKFSFT